MIPEHPVDPEHLTRLLVEDRAKNPSNYSVVLVSEGAVFQGHGEMSFTGDEADQFGHKKLGGVGDQVSAFIKEHSPAYNDGRVVNVVNQRLGYLVRSGDPDAMDSIAPMAFGNLALDLVLEGHSGLLVAVRNGVYTSVELDAVMDKKVVDVESFYNTERLRPKYDFRSRPLFLMTNQS